MNDTAMIDFREQLTEMDDYINLCNRVDLINSTIAIACLALFLCSFALDVSFDSRIFFACASVLLLSSIEGAIRKAETAKQFLARLSVAALGSITVLVIIKAVWSLFPL